MSRNMQQQMDRWVAEQIFEEDVRALVNFLRPHRHERLLGWNEMRSGGGGVLGGGSGGGENGGPKREGRPPRAEKKKGVESILVGLGREPEGVTPRAGIVRDCAGGG